MTSDNKLLIRIDERQKEMSKDISSIRKTLDCKVNNDSIYEGRSIKIERLWDDRNRLIGYMLGAGVAGGTMSSFLSGAVKVIFAGL